MGLMDKIKGIFKKDEDYEEDVEEEERIVYDLTENTMTFGRTDDWTTEGARNCSSGFYIEGGTLNISGLDYVEKSIELKPRIDMLEMVTSGIEGALSDALQPADVGKSPEEIADKLQDNVHNMGESLEVSLDAQLEEVKRKTLQSFEITIKNYIDEETGDITEFDEGFTHYFITEGGAKIYANVPETLEIGGKTYKPLEFKDIEITEKGELCTIEGCADAGHKHYERLTLPEEQE